MNQTVRIRMNGVTMEAEVGSTILDTAKRHGVYIPTLCHSPILRPLENCRLCVVQVAGEQRYKAACSTAVSEGMEITTDSPGLLETRKLLLDLLLDSHYGDCVAPCSVACPAGVDIQGYLTLIRYGEYHEALRLIKERIPMPATIGRVCPHPCESACRRHLVDESININHCKRFLADLEMKSNRRVLPQPAPDSGRKVAILGGGPAGLSAAYYLRSLGHGATIFEAREKLGGMLRYGIPEYRLPKRVLDWEIEGILSLGAQVRTGLLWGRDFSMENLAEEGFDAFFLAIGAWAARNLGIQSEEVEGVVRGIDFLESVAQSGRRTIRVGEEVAVIGGGNVAIDAARSALRLGARKVTILYRRSRAEMPASDEEIESAREEGVDIQYLVLPVRIEIENGVASSMMCVRMELGEPDASGRRRPVPIEGSEMTLKVDQIISAIGQYPLIPMAERDLARGFIPCTRWGTLGGDPKSMHTGFKNVFVGGDVFRGPATVVEALADGRKAAFSLDRLFQTGQIQYEPWSFNISKGSLKTIDAEPFGMIRKLPRETMRELDVAERIVNFDEVQIGFPQTDAVKEANRCLSCGCSAAFSCELRDLMNEYEIASVEQSSKRVHYQRVATVDNNPLIAVDPNKCIRCERCRDACAALQVSNAVELVDWARLNDRCVQCGLCVDLCPTGALMEKKKGRAVERLSWDTIKSHCIHCGCGCGIDVTFKGRKLGWVRDGSFAAPNWASSCRRGRFDAFDPLWFGDRVLKPLVRTQGKLDATSWPKAISCLISGFGNAGKRYTPISLGVIASPRASCEALYLTQKWFRLAMNSHGLDFPGRDASEKLWIHLKKTTGFNGMLRDLAELEHAEAIFVLGDGLEELAPVLATKIRRAVTMQKVPLWQIAAREDSLTSYASTKAIIPPELQCTMLSELARPFHRPSPQHGYSQVDPSSGWMAPGAAEPLGTLQGPVRTSFESLREALSHTSSVAFVLSEALFESEQTAKAAESFLRLASDHSLRAKGRGAGTYPVTREINSSGALLMGISPHYLPGFAAITDDRARNKVMELWGAPELSGINFVPVEEALEAGLIKALMVQDAALLRAKDPGRWDRLLERVELLVLLETSPSPAMEYAHVVLPVAAYAEQTGTVVNQELRLLKLGRAFEPKGDSLPDWEVLSRILIAQGLAFPKEIRVIHEQIHAVLSETAGFAWPLPQDGSSSLIRPHVG